MSRAGSIKGRRRYRAARTRPRVVHLTTSDISLSLLLGPQLRAFSAAGYEIVGVSSPGPHVKELESWGIAHHPLTSLTRSMSLQRDARALVELRSLFRTLSPDLVHTHNPKPGVYGRLAARAAGVPAVVNTVHGLYALPDDPLAKRALVYGLERVAVTCSDAELVQNPEDVETLRKLRVPGRKLHLLGNGIDLRRFDPARADQARRAALRESFGAGPDDVVCGVVGRLVWEKGYREVFAAAERLRTTAPNVKVVVVGPTDEAKGDAVDAAAMARAGRDGGISFLGMRDDVDDLYAAMDLYLLASHREGWPRSAMEAAAMRLPVIVTDIRGCRQVVDDGTTGLLVPVRDPDAIARAVSTLAADAGKRTAMGLAAREGGARVRRPTGHRHHPRGLRPAARPPPSRGGRVTLRPATAADAARMADLHRTRMTEGFLAVLGPRFLRLLYRRIVASPDAFAYVVEVERHAVVVPGGEAADPVVGFAAATTDVRDLYRRFVLRDGLIAGIAAAPRLLRSWRRVLETLRYPASAGALTDAPTEPLPDAEILSVAVDPGACGRGIGTQVVDAATAELARRGVTAAKVVTGADNAAALRLYARCGFVPHARIAVHEGTPSEVLVWRSS